MNAEDSAEIKLKKLLEEVRTIKSYDGFQTLQILRTCAFSSSIECTNEAIVEAIWAELRKKSEINEEHYLQLMRYYDRIKKIDKILKLFDELVALGLKLRAFVLNSNSFRGLVLMLFILNFQYRLYDCSPCPFEEKKHKKSLEVPL